MSLYYALAGYLTPDQAVLGLCAPQADVAGEQRPLERMAAQHVREIEQAQPDGPYLIVGECTGGALAYEIAQQLHAAGRRVAMLALIDAFPPGLPRLRRWMPRPLYRIVHRARIMGFHLGNLVRLDMDGRRAYVVAKARRAQAALKARSHDAGVRGRSRSARAHASSASPRLVFRDAFASYNPRPYPGPVVLYRAARMPLGARVPTDMGWGDLVEDLQVETIPGYFTTPISEPEVRTLADRLSRRLASAGDTSAS